MKKWNDEQRQRILREWKDSDLTRVEFCRKKEISLATLSNWKRSSTIGTEKTLGNQIDIVEISQTLPFRNIENRGFLRIITSTGTTIEVPL